MLPQGLLSKEAHRDRRQHLMGQMNTPVLLMGTGWISRNLPMNTLPFRQDSNLLYFTGCDLPNAAALIDKNGECTLFLPLPAEDDALWHGLLPSAEELREHFGVERVRSAQELESACALHPKLATLAIGDPVRNALAGKLAQTELVFGKLFGDEELVRTIIEMRNTKTPLEVEAHRRSAAITEKAHLAAMGATRPGGHEREIAALFNGVIAAEGCVTGYNSIVTVQGEVLHNPNHSNPLKAGQLLLLDGGAELPTGYGSDVTRTWPVSGRFSSQQSAAYDAVLEAQKASIELCRSGSRYRDVHLKSCEVIAQWLVDEKILLCGVQEAVETGAHALFFPHGVGHLLGLDVHDLEQFGDLPSYPSSRTRDTQFGLSYLRMDLDLKPGHLVTVEPGFYIIDAILNDPKLTTPHHSRLNREALKSWSGFGGIRIEDDILVTESAPDNLTGHIPRERTAVEEQVGSSLEASERFAP